MHLVEQTRTALQAYRKHAFIEFRVSKAIPAPGGFREQASP
jgi:hypothetical protein